MSKRLYVGHLRTGGCAVFRAASRPTEDQYGHLYFAVTGPFRTLAAARLDADSFPNPHIYCVADAERIVRQWRTLCRPCAAGTNLLRP
jgi:hypothetical protein